MAHSRGLDFLFCKLCGTHLSFNSTRFAECPLCGSKRKAKEIAGKETRYTVTAEEIRRELSIEPFVKLGEDTEEVIVQRAVSASDVCPKCGHVGLEYYTKQLRSVDEGQTVFFQCPKCPYKTAVNT
ncbi:Zinc finger, TFIIS-type [Dillenia turbinata]|uniref:DNA-directed RNA polymerase subunit n=1 Tax=Dillenia turbinata TaxID=194707 RepID=A0AAN8VRY7_9MAGN